MKKIYSHKCIHRKTPVVIFFFNAVAGLRAYSFMKKGLHVRYRLVKFVKFYRISFLLSSLISLFLQKTAGRLLPISSNISDISLGLLPKGA